MSAPVLQLISSSSRRGAEIFAVDLAAALKARGRVVETLALTTSPSPNPLDVRALGAKSLAPTTLLAVRRAAASASIVVAHGSRSLPATAAATFGLRTRFVYRSIGDVVSYASTPLRRARVALYLHRAIAVVALWPGAARALSEHCRVPTEKIRVIPNGVPAERFRFVDREPRAAARRHLGLPEDGGVALFLGALIPDKAADAAVDAVTSVPSLQLVIAGAGPDRARVESYAKARLPHRVHFMGAVSDPAIVLAAADVLLLPSRTEGMPAVAIEAGLSGLPVVATDVGAVGEVVVHGETGIVVRPGDSEALADGVRRALVASQAMGVRARQHCLKRFEIGVVSAAWDRLLDELEAEKESGFR
jgi:glycosyltransferase involved in cell wall biosynthesis